MKIKSIFLALAISTACVTQVFAYSDVTGDEWYAGYVENLTNRNVINGFVDGTFQANRNITNGEVLKIAITAIGQSETPLEKYTNWADGYLETAIWLGLSVDSSIDLNGYATRYFVAQIMFDLIGADKININSPFSDIDDKMVNTLYELGVINGIPVGDEVLFFQENKITRSEVCAIVIRAIEIIEKNISPRKYSHQTVSDIQNPQTVDDFKQVLLKMAINNESQKTIFYPTINFYEMVDYYKYHENVVQAFKEVFDEYPEYFTFANQLSAPLGGTMNDSDIELSLSSSYFSQNQIITYQKDFFDEVEDIWHILRLNGSIVDSMSQRQKAEVFFEWIVVNNEYDLSYNKVSYTAYGIVTNNTGVCQGYVALFNALCKMEGIEVYGMSGIAGGGEHIWSVAVLDGQKCYIDPTFADPVPNKKDYCDFNYFDISESQLRTTHYF